MAFRPTAPPRRGAPPLPARESTPEAETPIDDKPPVGGIAAKIAALKLGQVGGGGGAGLPAKTGPGPVAPKPTARPIPPRRVVSAAAAVNSIQNGNHGGASESPPEPQVQKHIPPPPRPPLRTANGNGNRAKVTHASEILLQTISPEELARALRRPPPPIPPKRPSVATWPGPAPAAEEEQEEEQEEEEEETPAPVEPPALPPRRVTAPPLPSRTNSSTSIPRHETTSREPSTPSPPPANAPLPNRRLPPPPSRNLPPMEPRHIARPPTPPEPEPEPEPEAEPEEETHAHSTQEGDPDVCMKCRDFSFVDAHAAQFPRQQVQSIERLAYDLTSPFESITDKARAIFTWLHHNIAYDAYSFLNNCVKAQSPVQTLRAGLAVCDGYAGLFCDLALHAGLQALKVTGHGKGYGYTSTESGIAPPYNGNHAWNAVVFDDNEWHLIDSCWGAGHLKDGEFNKEFAPQWFTMDNMEFGQRHYPEEAGYQLREDGTVMSWEEYILAPAGVVEFGEFRKRGFDLNSLLPQSKSLQRGQWHTFHIEKACWHIERRDWWTDYPLIVQPSANERIVLDRDERGPGNGWTVKAFVPHGSTTPVTLYYVDKVDGKDAKGIQPGELKKMMGRKGMSFAGVAQWSVV